MASSEIDRSRVVSHQYLLYLAGKLGKEWKDLGRLLNVSDTDIDNTTTDNPGNVKEAKYQMLKLWTQKERNHATYHVLAEALVKIERGDLADELLKDTPSPSSASTPPPVKTDTPTPSSASTPSLAPTSVKTGYRQFCIKLESLLTSEHVHKLATSFGYAADKIEDISKSVTPSRVLVRLMDESGEISPTDISKLITALEKETGLEDFAVEVNETFELYGKSYAEVLLTLESNLTRRDAVLLAEYFDYPAEKIGNIRESETPSHLLVQLICERDDVSPMDNSKLKRALKQVCNELATKIDEAFELQRKTTQFVNELRSKYKNQVCGRNLPFPFLHDKYDIDKLFVESGMQFQENKEGNDDEQKGWKELKNHEMIFTQIKSNRRIIDGEPGYGKSFLALQITHDWCQREASMKDFSILIFLRLSLFRNVSNVYAAIKKYLLPRSNLNDKDIKNILDTCSSSAAVFILDEYDEYPERGNKESDIECIIRGDMFQKQEVVLLTRTSCLPETTTSNTKRIKLTGFNDDLRFEYIRDVVTNSDSEQAKEINQLIENHVAADLCTVPLFCAMISHMTAHMAKENKPIKHLDTVTELFKRVIDFFYSRKQIAYKTSTKKSKVKRGHSKLDRVAFESLRETSQKITWDRNELRGEIGEDLYDEYERIGILREEEAFDDDEWDYKTDTRFFHKLFVEWYAAHYLANEVLQSSTRSDHRHNTNEEAQGTSQQQYQNREEVNLLLSLPVDPRNSHYTYRFACGLSNEAALEIIKHLGTNKRFDQCTLLCIAEWMEKGKDSLDIIEDTAIALCSRILTITEVDSSQTQKCTVELIKFAFRRGIPITILLMNSIPDQDKKGNFILKPSKMSLPVMDTNSQLVLRITQFDHLITKEQIESMLQYLAKSRGEIHLLFYHFLLPRYITVTESMSTLTSRDEEIFVYWLVTPGNGEQFRLNFNSGQWESLEDSQPITDEKYRQMDRVSHWHLEGKGSDRKLKLVKEPNHYETEQEESVTSSE